MAINLYQLMDVRLKIGWSQTVSVSACYLDPEECSFEKKRIVSTKEKQ